MGRLESWLTRIPFMILGLLLGFVAFLKSGIEIPGLVTIWDPSTWPDPVDIYPHMSYGLRTLGWITGANSFGAYALLSAFVVVAALLSIIVMLRSAVAPQANRFVLLILLGGPVAWALFSTFGRPDPLTIAGGIMIGTLGRRWYWAVIGVFFAILGNADQAVVLCLSALVVSLHSSLKPWRLPALIALILSVAASLSLTAWGTSAGVPTRGGLFDDFWRQSIQQFVSAAPIQLYAGLGISSLVLIWAIFDGSWRSSLPIIAGMIILPMIFTATTLDQSRVFICCSSAACAVVITHWGPRIMEFLSSRFASPLSAIFLVILFLPAVEIAGNIVRVPWFSYIPFIQTYVVAPITGSG